MRNLRLARSFLLMGSLVAGPALSACVGTDADTSSTRQAICGLACGDNGGVVDGLPFWELELGGSENSQGVKLLHYAASEGDANANHWGVLDVESDRLRAWHNGLLLTGTALVNSVLVISINGDEYYVKITEVDASTINGQRYWTAGAAAGGPVETYRFQWRKKPNTRDHYQDFCPNLTSPTDPWLHQVHAVVFEGERYDPDTRKISLSAPNTWFNIACAGGLPAKMHMVRRTTASSSGTLVTSIDDDRQAFARMWAADYCGDGFSFTETGHKLRVRDRRGWLPMSKPVGFSAADTFSLGFSYEAVWDAGGAVCLDVPRLIDVDPTIQEAVAKRCSIPTCASMPWFPAKWKEHGLILSANPPSPVIVQP